MEDPQAPPPLPAAPVRWMLLCVAVARQGVGVLGGFVPVLTTVPVQRVAGAWAAARSSPRLSHWLENHPKFGAMIRDWRAGGVVRRRTKWNATVVMALSAVVILLTVRKPWAAGLAIGCMACVLLWLWQRPEG